MKTKTIKVGGVTYTVMERPYIEIDGDRNFWGKCDAEQQSIEVQISLHPERKAQVIVHELTHAIFNEAGYKDHSEEMVERLSLVLYQVLKDNDLKNLINIENGENLRKTATI